MSELQAIMKHKHRRMRYSGDLTIRDVGLHHLKPENLHHSTKDFPHQVNKYG